MKLNFFSVIIALILISSVYNIYEDGKRFDRCSESGGVFIKTFSGYRCFKNQFELDTDQ